MTFVIGTVTVEATQLATDVDVQIEDRFGVKKRMTFANDRIQDVPWDSIAENDVHYSQWQTRRN